MRLWTALVDYTLWNFFYAPVTYLSQKECSAALVSLKRQQRFIWTINLPSCAERDLYPCLGYQMYIFLKKKSIHFSFRCFLPTCKYTYCVHTWCSWRPKEDNRSPGAEVTESCKLYVGVGNELLPELQMHLAADLSFYPTNISLNHIWSFFGNAWLFKINWEMAWLVRVVELFPSCYFFHSPALSLTFSIFLQKEM